MQTKMFLSNETANCKYFAKKCSSLHYIDMTFLIENADNLFNHSTPLQQNIILCPSVIIEIIHQITPN